MNKWVINTKENKMCNLSNVIDIVISANYLIFTTIDSREVRVMYGAEKDLKKVFDAIKSFLVNNSNILDVCNYMA